MTIETVLIICASVAGYLFGASAMFVTLERQGFEPDKYSGEPNPGAVFGAVLWPIAFFLLLGSLFAKRIVK